MKMKKIIMFIFLLMISLVGINASSLNDNLEYGSHFNNGNADDWSINGNDGVVIGPPSATTDKNNVPNKALDFDGANDYVNAKNIGGDSIYTVSIWVSIADLSDGTQFVISKRDGASEYMEVQFNADGTLRFLAANEVFLDTNSAVLSNTVWTNLIFVYDYTQSLAKIYVNSVDTAYTNIGSNPLNTFTAGNVEDLHFGNRQPSNSLFYRGKIDEPRLWTRALNSTEVLEVYNLYDQEISTTPTLEFTNISANNITLINNSFFNSSINFETTVLNTSTNGLINHSYSLNGGSFIQYATNTLIGSVDLNLSEDYYNISFCAENNETNICSTNYSLIVDRTAPILTLIGNLTQDTFFINFSTIFNVNYSISGEDFCNLNITYLEANESDSNFFINCTDTQLFTRAGLYNGFITAKDNAGNIITNSVNGTINPVINIFFAQTNSSIIFNYTPTIFHPDGRVTFPEIQPDGNIQLSPVNNGELDLGNHTIQFEKIGFLTQNFTQIVNSTNAGINVTFNASTSIINLIIRDKKTSSIISGPTFDIDFVATVGLSTNTSTGNLTISNIFFLSEDYRVDISNSLYKTESIFFTFTNQEILNTIVYMSLKNDSTIGFVTIKVSDRFGNPLSGAKVEALQWDSITSTYIPVSQQNTDEKGLGVLNIILDSELYKFRATLNGLQIESVDQRITESENGKEIPLRLSALTSEENYILENVLTVVTEDFNESTNISIITFDWEDLTGISQTVCINAFRITNGVEIKLTNDTSQCVQGVSGTLIRAFHINSSYTTNLQAQVKLEEDYIKVKSFPHYSEFFISNIIDNLKLTQFATPVLFILAITLGFATNIYLGVIGLALASIGSIWITPTVLNGSVIVFFLFIAAVTLSGGKKP